MAQQFQGNIQPMYLPQIANVTPAFQQTNGSVTARQQQLFNEMSILSNDRIGQTTSNFNSLKSRLWNHRVTQSIDPINYSQQDIQTLKQQQMSSGSYDQFALMQNQSVNSKSRQDYTGSMQRVEPSKKNSSILFTQSSLGKPETLGENQINASYLRNNRNDHINLEEYDSAPLSAKRKLRTPSQKLKKVGTVDLKKALKPFEQTQSTLLGSQVILPMTLTSRQFYSNRNKQPKQKRSKSKSKDVRSKSRGERSVHSNRSVSRSQSQQKVRFHQAVSVYQQTASSSKPKNSRRDNLDLAILGQESYQTTNYSMIEDSLPQKQNAGQFTARTPHSNVRVKRMRKPTTAAQVHQQESISIYQHNELLGPRGNSPQKQSSSKESPKKRLQEAQEGKLNTQLALNAIVDEIEKKKEITASMKSRTAQAQSDKIELMRDLATYESNFAEDSNLRSTLMRLHKQVFDIQIKMEKTKTYHSQNWFDISIQEKILNNFNNLKQSTQRKGQAEEFNPASAARKKDLNQTPKTKLTTRDLRRMQTSSIALNEGDQVQESMDISGLHCMVTSQYMSGSIQVQVCPSTSLERFSIEMKPNMNKRIKVDLSDELKRLYFFYGPLDGGKSKLQLLNRDDYKENPYFLIKLKGDRSKFFNAKFNKDGSNIECMITNGSNESFKFVLFNPGKENYQTGIGIKGQDGEIKYPIVDLYKTSYQQLAKIIEDQFVILNTGENIFQLKNIAEVHDKRIKSKEWMNKIQNGIQDPNDLESNKIRAPPKPPVIVKKEVEIQKEKPNFEDDISSVILESESMLSEGSFKMNSPPPENRRESQKKYNKSPFAKKSEVSELKRNNSQLGQQSIEEVAASSKLKRMQTKQMSNPPPQFRAKAGPQSTHGGGIQILSQEKKRSQVESLPDKIEDYQIARYEFFYIFKWKKYNIELQKLYNKRDAEKLKQMKEEEEKKKKEQQRIIREHDDAQIKKLMSEMFNFRSFFKAIVDMDEAEEMEEVYQSEVKANDQQTLLMSYREQHPGPITVLITIIKDDTGSALPSWLYSLEMNEQFVKQLDLMEYSSLRELSEKLVEFSQTQLFEELIKTVPLPKDERRYFKVAEESGTPITKSVNMSQTPANPPMRRMYTQRTQLQDASEGDDESYFNETSSKYSKFK